MELDKDFKEFLQLLEKNEVEYLIVGGYAVAFHGYPRFTGDLDIWVNPTSENAIKLTKALDDFGFETEELLSMDFENETVAFHMGTPPVRIDIMNKISGVKFSDCYTEKLELDLDGLKINYINLPDLIKNKKATARFKDLDDIENLQ